VREVEAHQLAFNKKRITVKCPYCGYEFETRKKRWKRLKCLNCRRYIFKEDIFPEFRLYRCKYCGFQTGSRKEIRKHVREVHGIKGGKLSKRGMGVEGAFRRDPLSHSYESIIL